MDIQAFEAAYRSEVADVAASFIYSLEGNASGSHERKWALRRSAAINLKQWMLCQPPISEGAMACIVFELGLATSGHKGEAIWTVFAHDVFERAGYKRNIE